MSALLDEVESIGQFDYAKAIGYDGFSSSVPAEALRRSWLVTMRGGTALSQEDGFPARLIVPGLSGYKSIKWLTRIEIGSSPNSGYWEQRGWSPAGILEPRAWLDQQTIRAVAGQRLTLAGSAYAGNLDVSQVVISINFSDWMPAEVLETSTAGLTRWRATWVPHSPGSYAVVARATTSAQTIFPQTDHQPQSLFRRPDLNAGRIEVSA